MRWYRRAVRPRIGAVHGGLVLVVAALSACNGSDGPAAQERSSAPQQRPAAQESPVAQSSPDAVTAQTGSEAASELEPAGSSGAATGEGDPTADGICAQVDLGAFRELSNVALGRRQQLEGVSADCAFEGEQASDGGEPASVLVHVHLGLSDDPEMARMQFEMSQQVEGTCLDSERGSEPDVAWLDTEAFASMCENSEIRSIKYFLTTYDGGRSLSVRLSASTIGSTDGSEPVAERVEAAGRSVTEAMLAALRDA